MGLNYLVSYQVEFLFEDWSDEDIRNKELLSVRLADTMYQMLQDGNYPNPDDIEVELTE